MFFLKRFITVFLITILGFLPMSAMAQSTSYPDVGHGYKYYEAIEAMTKRKVIEGYPDGYFRPEDPINRAEAVKVLIGALYDPYVIEHSLDENLIANHSYAVFPDVPIYEWFAKYVKTSYDNDVVHGYPDGYFRPANFINFAEALKVILRSHNPDDLYSIPFKHTDLLYVNEGEWFEPYFTYARAKNLLDPNKFYHPAQLITRGEFVQIMYRLQHIEKYNLDKFEITREVTSNEYTVTIPRLGIIDVKVNFADIYNVQSALNTLLDGLGHSFAKLGEGGTTIQFGHSSNYSWIVSDFNKILANIDDLEVGDKLYYNYREKAYIYQIYKTEIIPAHQDKKMLENMHEDKLILYTCWWPGSISHRYLVYAKEVAVY